MAFCKNCGSEINPNFQFCGNCGTKVDVPVAAPVYEAPVEPAYTAPAEPIIPPPPVYASSEETYAAPAPAYEEQAENACNAQEPVYYQNNQYNYQQSGSYQQQQYNQYQAPNQGYNQYGNQAPMGAIGASSPFAGTGALIYIVAASLGLILSVITTFAGGTLDYYYGGLKAIMMIIMLGALVFAALPLIGHILMYVAGKKEGNQSAGGQTLMQVFYVICVIFIILVMFLIVIGAILAVAGSSFLKQIIYQLVGSYAGNSVAAWISGMVLVGALIALLIYVLALISSLANMKFYRNAKNHILYGAAPVAPSGFISVMLILSIVFLAIGAILTIAFSFMSALSLIISIFGMVGRVMILSSYKKYAYTNR